MEERTVRLGDSAPREGHLHRLMSEHPDFEVLHESTLHVYSFRYLPNALAHRMLSPELESRLDRLNEKIAETIPLRGLARVATTRIEGRVALRMSIGSHLTLEDVEATFEELAGGGRRLAGEAGLGAACREPARLPETHSEGERK